MAASRIPPFARRVGRVMLVASARQNALHEWRRRLGGEPRLPETPIRRVLVICHGNICRSPFAAQLLSRRLAELSVRSAGLAAREGAPAEPEAIETARDYAIDLSRHAAHRLTDEDLDWADLVIAMEGHHLLQVGAASAGARARTRLLGDYLAEPPHRIDDPWGREPEFFAATFERIVRGVERLGEVLERRTG